MGECICHTVIGVVMQGEGQEQTGLRKHWKGDRLADWPGWMLRLKMRLK